MGGPPNLDPTTPKPRPCKWQIVSFCFIQAEEAAEEAATPGGTSPTGNPRNGIRTRGGTRTRSGRTPVSGFGSFRV